jgi:hypothetical protein
VGGAQAGQLHIIFEVRDSHGLAKLGTTIDLKKQAVFLGDSYI